MFYVLCFMFYVLYFMFYFLFKNAVNLHRTRNDTCVNARSMSEHPLVTPSHFLVLEVYFILFYYHVW